MPQASLPSPRTWSSGDLVTVPRLRADVSDAVAFLLARPVFAGQNNSGQAWSAGADNGMGLNVEITDTWNGHVAVSTGSIFNNEYWAPVPGWYLCRSAPAFSYSGSTQYMFAGGLQGTTGGVAWGPQRGPLVLNGSTHSPIPQCIDLVEMLNAGPPGGSGDYVSFTGYQGTTGSINLSTGTQLPIASARWVCATSGTQPLPVPPLTAVPTPITSAWMNANVRDTINMLIYPPVMRAYYTAGSSTLANTTFPAGSVVPLNSLTVDNYNGFNTSTFTYTAPLAGRYFIAGQANLASSTATTAYACGISVNGGTVLWGDDTYKVSDTTGGGAGFARRVRLTAGQTVQLMARQGSGSAIAYNTSGTNPTRLIIVWEGT